MIISNSLAGSGYPAPGAAKAGSSPAAPASNNEPIQTGGMRPYSSETNRDAAMAMHQTARIMALVGSMRNVDDVSAYSIFDRADNDTDQYRQVVNAYQDNS